MGLISRLQLLWAATKSGGEAYHNSRRARQHNLEGKGAQPPEVAGARRCPWLRFKTEVSLRGRVRVCGLPPVHQRH